MIIKEIIAVMNNLIPVTTSNVSCFNACFPRTVELPQQNEAKRAHNDAIVDLSSQFPKGLFPKVTRYPPNIAIIARNINRFDSFSFRMTPASEIANNGCSF